jgi:hypothetical protein
MFPQVSYSSVRVRQIAGLGSCRTTADILLVHNHSGLTDAAERWSIRGMGLGVRRCIACVTNRSLAVHSRTCHEATRLGGIVAALPILFEGSAANLLVFHKPQRICVVGMTAADG